MPLTFEDILKFNPYHDSKGRFASANSATSFTIRTKDPSKQHLADAAREREKERDAAGGSSAPADADNDTPQMKAVHDFEDKIRHQNYESAAVVDKDGNLVINKDGGKSMVGFTPMECLMMRDNTLTHNHPSSSMFSTEDAQCFVKNNLQEIRATTREGKTFSFSRNSDYTPEKGVEFVRDYNKRRHVAQTYAQADLDSRGFAEKIWRGEITNDQANREFSRVMTNQLVEWAGSNAPKYGVEFKVETRTVSKIFDYVEYTSKAAAKDDDEIVMILDQKSEEEDAAAFNEWLSKKKNTQKPEKVVTQKMDTHDNEYSIFKTDDDKRLVFGWASISITVEGEQLEDLQKDLIDPEDLEEAAYEYVLHFRDTGELHNPNLRKKGKLVESCVFTVEKQKAMGLPEGLLPVGWWIGFKIEDDEAWEKVKNGTYKMFSIEGKAQREPV